MFRMGKNDHAAIVAILAGEKEAYAALVVRHAPSLFRVAFRITGNEADADDVVQEAFMRAYQRLAAFESRSSFGTWVYRIAIRCALDRLQHRAPDPESSIADNADPGHHEIQLADNAAGPDRLLLDGEIGALRQTAMLSLSPTEHTAFVLRHLEQRTCEEIGVALGIQPNAAKQAVFRAVEKLRRRLAPLRTTR